MDSTITIRTADDLPVKVIVPRAILIAGSKVFADMLSLPQGSTGGAGEDSFDVTETEKDLKPFLRLLNLAHEDGDPVEELQVGDWPIVARLADKYDAAGVLIFVMWKYREFCQFKGDPSRLASAFGMAVSLNRKDLAQDPAFHALAWGLYESDDLLGEWEPQFKYWLLRLKLHAFEYSVQDACVTHDFANCDCKKSPEVYWRQAMRPAMKDWRASTVARPFLDHLWDQCRDSEMCDRHQMEFMQAAQNVEGEYRNNLPDFPL
ncbi:hypothetical protein JCM10450v2_002840 [Rhodotorula kratochvilovae]